MSHPGDAVPNFALAKLCLLIQSLIATSHRGLIIYLRSLLVLATDLSGLVHYFPMKQME